MDSPSTSIRFLRLFAFAAIAGLLAAQEPQFAPGQPKPAPAAAPAPPPARPNFFGLPPAPDPVAVERGQKLFVANCGFCHGSLAKGGNNGPDLVRSVLVLNDDGAGSNVGPVVLEGRPAKGMPKFNLSSAEVKDISAFLMSRSQATVLRGEYKILNLVTGDSKAGQAYFAANCASCHSTTGDLAHIASKYDAPTLQGRFLYPRARTSPKAQLNATVTLPSGQSFSGIVNAIDDFSISLTDASGQYRTWELDDSSGIKAVVRDPLEGHEKLLRRYTDTDMHNILTYLVTLR
jgi:mono/diheme cytochrome c family protein